MITNHENLNQFPVRVLVAGSRNFDNYQLFDQELQVRLQLLLRNIPLEKICFISGEASYGADDMIIYWCEVNNIPCFKFPADWDKFGKMAGYIRNKLMSLHCTHAILFWDGISNGTRNVRNLLKSKQIPLVTYNVKRSEHRSKHYRKVSHDSEKKRK